MCLNLIDYVGALIGSTGPMDGGFVSNTRTAFIFTILLHNLVFIIPTEDI